MNSLSSNDGKRMQSIDSMKTYAYGNRKDLVSEKEEIRRNNIISDTKMINFNDVTSGNIKEHNLTWPQILDHTDKILIIGGFGSEKTNLLFNLIILDIDNTYLHSKDLC